MKKSSSPSNKSQGSNSGDNDNGPQPDALEPIPIWSFTNDNSIQLTFINPSINGSTHVNDSSSISSSSAAAIATAASDTTTTEAAGSSPSHNNSNNSSNTNSNNNNGNGLSPKRKEQLISNAKQQSSLNGINQELPSIIRVGCTTAIDKYSEGQGICGLHNLGNTCYLNAVLQALSACPPITHLSRMRCGWEFVLPARQRSSYRTDFQERRYQFANNLLMLMEFMWSGKEKALVPRQVARCVIDIVPEFNAYGQQDAQEAMNYILNNLHEEISAPVPPECHPAREFLVLFEKEMVELYHKYKQDNKNKGNSKNSPQIQQQQQASSSSKNSKSTSQGGSMSKSMRSRLKNAKGASAKQKASSTASESTSSVAGTGLDMSSNEQQQDQDEDDTASSSQQETSDSNGEPKVRQVHSLYEQSVVSDAFSTFLAQKIVCSHCGFTSQQLEEYLEISVALPNKAQIKELREDGNGESSSGGMMSFFKGLLGMGANGLQLDDCLRAFFSKEKLDGQNQYHCDNCKTKRDAVKSVNLAHAPQILCVHLKRFNKVNGWGLGNAKNTTMVNFPVDGLDMSPYLHEVAQKAGGNPSQCVYDLISVVKHTGTVNRGHYIANCRNMVNNKWYEYDDDLRYEISTDSLQTSDVYLLLYSKRPTKANLENKIALEEALKKPIPAQIDNADQELFYVPNYWISQWKSLSNPGPVCAANIACEHGGLLHTVKDDYFKRVVAVPKSTWKVIEERYGVISPRLTNAKVCEKCLAVYEAICKRRKEEEKVVNKLDAKEADSGWYLLSTNWLKKWHAFLGNDIGPAGRGTWVGSLPPGPISNDLLLESDGKPKKNLKKVTHYRGVNKHVWEYLVGIYGGGPMICRNTIEIYDETPVVAKKEQQSNANESKPQKQNEQQTKL